MIETFLSVCGGISIVGGAIAVIWKVIKPAFGLTKKVEDIEKHQKSDYERIIEIDKMQKQQCKSLAALINHELTGNGIDELKKIRDDLLASIIDIDI
jgi:hypothetical protein